MVEVQELGGGGGGGRERKEGISFTHPSFASNLVETALSPQTLAMMMMMMVTMWSLMSSDVGLTYKGQTVTNACAMVQCCLTATQTIRLIKP